MNLSEYLRGALVATSGAEVVVAAATDGTCPRAQDWALGCCCSSVQIQLIAASLVYALLIFLLWNYQVLLPLKLVVVALHEFSHALAAWLSCGSVKGIEINADEGGKTTTTGGNRIFILSAGYLGSSLWGMLLIISAANFVGVQVAAGLLGVALLLSLLLARSLVTVLVTSFFLLLIAGFWACTILTEFNGLRFVILLVGVMSSLFSVYDIYADVLARKVHESDAAVLAKLTHTSSRCWGVIWTLVSLGLFGVGIYLSLVVGGAPGET